MKTITTLPLGMSKSRPIHSRLAERSTSLCAWVCLLTAVALPAEPSAPNGPRTWPQAYSVQHDEPAGLLRLCTSYYTVEQDLRKGGAITRIALTHGKATNLLVEPLETRVQDESGSVFTDLHDTSPTLARHADGLNEIVTVEAELKDDTGRGSGVRVKTTLQYRWGYIKIRKQFSSPNDVRVREICPLSAVLAPSLACYGYREGITEEEKAPPFAFGSNRWGKLRIEHPSDPPLETHYTPRSMLFVDPGVEGLEWFVGSDLSQWELQISGRRGTGRCLLDRAQNQTGLALSIATFWSSDTTAPLPSTCIFDFYLAFPLIDGQAHRPWLHTSFNRNRGEWVSTEEIGRWAEKGIQTVHCHNDGDYYDDGLFWRDGSYPPYPDMDRYDKVLEDCRRVGIRTATYFSKQGIAPEYGGVSAARRAMGSQESGGKPAAQLLSAGPRVWRANVPSLRLAGILEALHRPSTHEPSAKRRLL